MKNEKGVTLASVIIYVVVMLVIVVTVGTITSFFYSNSRNLESSAESLGEFNKFNTHFLKQVKKEGNDIQSIDSNKVTFTSGTTFTFEGDGIYENKVKLCSSVKQCKFVKSNENEKEIISVHIEIGNDFAKNMEYVMDY